MNDLLTSASGIRMLTYVAPVYENSRQMKAIFQSNGLEVDELHQWVEDIQLQAFPQTATWGLRYWEQSLGIPVDETKPLEQRREYVMSKLIGVGTPTKKLIQDTAKAFTNGEVEITVLTNYTFSVKFMSLYGVPANMEQFKATINNIKPAHMTVIYEYSYLTCGVFNSYQLSGSVINALNIKGRDFKLLKL